MDNFKKIISTCRVIAAGLTPLDIKDLIDKLKKVGEK